MIVGSSTMRMRAARVNGCTAGESSVCFVKFASESAPILAVMAFATRAAYKCESRTAARSRRLVRARRALEAAEARLTISIGSKSGRGSHRQR